jgi:DNA (cytosine-5)-methyltransferase 1
VRTHLDLFSGIGGFALAANWAGFTTVGFVEYEDYPRRILGKQFPGVPIFGDIHDFDATPFRGVDLITGGFPCPPFSVAGKQRGKEDDRYLWPEMLRVIVEAQPRWVLAENVAGIINMALDEVLADLEAQDYATATVILPACAKNAIHIRQRCWVIARNVGNSDSKRCQGQQVCVQQGRQDQTRSEISWAGPDVAHSNSERGCSRDSEWQDAEDAGQSSRGAEHGTGITEPRLGGSLDGIPTGLDFPRRWGDGSWEDGVPRVTVGAKNRTQRLKALGNAIVPQVAYEIIRHFD